MATAKGKTDSSNTTCQDIITRGDVKAPITLVRRWIASKMHAAERGASLWGVVALRFE
jgi:hypothetical protein